MKAKEQQKRLPFKTITLYSLILLVLSGTRLNAQVVVDIPDANLEAAIREALGIPTEPLTDTNLAYLTGLIAYERGITNLTGLDYCVNLTGLWLFENNISNISPLAGLTNLTYLNLDNNNISDISPLAGLTNLTNLQVDENNISNITPLAGLTNLTILDLDHTNIIDISPLAGLTNLTELLLEENNISDISSLAGLTNLTSLDLDENNISEISPLAGLTNLMFLELDDNNINNIDVIEGLTNLSHLELNYNNISNISPLADLMNLMYLDLEENPLNCDAYMTFIPLIIENNPDIEIYYDPMPLWCSATGIDELIELLFHIKDVITSLPVEVFHNKNASVPLINKIDAVLDMLGEDNYEGALNKLKNDILAKTNGCAETGMPDKNDWIITCEAQAELYPIISEAIAILENLL